MNNYIHDKKEGIYMKKKIFSFLLASVLVLTSASQIAFARENDASVYYGISLFAKAEDALDDLSADANSAESVLDLRDDQLSVLSAAKTAFYAKTYDQVSGTAWDAYYAKIVSPYTTEYEQKVTRYFKMRYIQSQNAIPAVSNALTTLDADPAYNTAGKTLQEANTIFDTYITQLNGIYAANSTEIEGYMTGKDTQLLNYEKEALFDSTKIVLGLIYSTVGEGNDNSSFDYSFIEDFNKNDIAKKNLALFFGKTFTRELATNNITTVVRNYISSNPQAISDINTMLANVFVYNKSNAVDAIYDVLGKVINDAYSSNPAQAEVVNFFGDGTNQGALEIVMDIFDASSEVQNIWVNLFIREFVQMKGASSTFKTIDAASPNPLKTEVYNNMSASFLINGLDDYGISSSNVPLRSHYFNIQVSCDEPNYSNQISYDTSTGKFSVTTEVENLPDTYYAVLTLYRSDSTTFNTADTYIESYPIRITNKASSGGGSRFDVKVTENENGTIIGPSTVSSRDKETTFVADPKEGYIVDKIIVNGVEVPITRNGAKATFTVSNVNKNLKIEPVFIQFVDFRNHSAYIIGDDKGNFNPYKNLTRGETATIFHRLLTDAARHRFELTESIYDDVPEELWSALSILSLGNAGILSGYPDNTYRPEGSVTRAEFATIVCKIYDVEEGGKTNLKDVSGHWAERYIAGIANKGWITGYPDLTFKPDNYITRAEAVTIINRMMNCELTDHDVDGDIGYFDTEPTDWFFIDVIKASTDHLN